MTYGALLLIIDKVGEFGFLPHSDIDLYEARAQFARCVYEIHSGKDRVEAMLEATCRIVARKRRIHNQPSFVGS
jgi:hypothetical protein